MTNLLYHLWICYIEEHKALKYRDYHDKLYMIIGTENVDDTHPYMYVLQSVLKMTTLSFVHCVRQFCGNAEIHLPRGDLPMTPVYCNLTFA